MIVLGIETSCDETAAAVVSDTKGILSNVVWSQVAEHQPYGGVVPEIAARSHITHISSVLEEALNTAGVALPELDAIAATGGPGLIGGVIVGVMTAKALASVHHKPFIAVNHLEGHALTVRLTDKVEFPYLMLLVSGGHCQFLVAEGVGRYRKLGGTVDDALGEAFDKVAKMLGMPYPGGSAVEAMARKGDPKAYPFTVPLKGREGCDFSFSGLKTALREQIDACREQHTLNEQVKADICASFQHTAAECIADRMNNAVRMFRQLYPHGNTFVLAGGVAANQYLRGRMENILADYGMTLVAPPIKLCTDNAAMIAWAGLERFRLGYIDGMDFEPRARWPLSA